MDIPIKARLTGLLLFESKTITFLLSIIGFLLGTGFYFFNISNVDYAVFYSLADMQYWGIVFYLYGSIKLLQSIRPISQWLKIAGSSLGMWLWTYLIFGFLLLDQTQPTPEELLLIVPLICEMGELVINMFNCRKCTT